MPEPTKNCPTCGEANESVRSYCWVCYNNFDGSPRPTSVIPTLKAAFEAPRRKSTWQEWLRIFLISVVAILVIILAIPLLLFLACVGFLGFIS